jgi:signal transduction histidine kinase
VAAVTTGVQSGQQRNQVDVRLESRHGENIVILFVVTDTGPGIAAEHQELVFQAFNRPDAAEAPGSGLGLPIASRIAGMTGGRVWIESEAGRGSKIYATIRLRADEEYSSKSRFQTLPVGA